MVLDRIPHVDVEVQFCPLILVLFLIAQGVLQFLHEFAIWNVIALLNNLSHYPQVRVEVIFKFVVLNV